MLGHVGPADPEGLSQLAARARPFAEQVHELVSRGIGECREHGGVDGVALTGFVHGPIMAMFRRLRNMANVESDDGKAAGETRLSEKDAHMDMKIYFPGGKRVYADYGGFTIETDQPARGGGDGSAPAPFDLFLASIGTCAGIYALGFMQQRGIDPEGSKLTMRTHVDPSVGLVGKIDLELKLPAGFPEKYRDAVVNAMNLCAVKKHLHQPPAFEITTVAG